MAKIRDYNHFSRVVVDMLWLLSAGEFGRSANYDAWYLLIISNDDLFPVLYWGGT